MQDAAEGLRFDRGQYGSFTVFSVYYGSLWLWNCGWNHINVKRVLDATSDSLLLQPLATQPQMQPDSYHKLVLHISFITYSTLGT